MKIDILSETTLKLTLTEEDMKESRLCYETLSNQPKDCRKALERLIEKGASTPKSAALAAELLEEESRLLVEAFPASDGGCMVYLSALNRSKSKSKPTNSGTQKNTQQRQSNKTNLSRNGLGLLDRQVQASPIIFETNSEEMLGKLCRHLETERKSGMEFSSKLFLKDNCYRLALTPLTTCGGRLTRILKEYGNAAVHSELIAAYTEEHFTLIMEEKAAELCQKLF